MDFGLTDRVVIVTGAASGIGAAVARMAAASGAALLLTDRDGPGLARVGAELRAGTVQADLAEPAAPTAIAAAALARFGRIDGLVNAAALTSRGTLADSTPALWDDLFAVNARAPFFLMQAAIADMRARRAPGVVVNILSVNAHCGRPDLTIYSATKGALLTLTRNAAHAHMADRIRVNGINLGWAETGQEHALQTGVLGQPQDWAARAGAGLPLGRLVQPEEVARLVVFLLADASIPMSGVAMDLEQKVLGAPA